MNNTEANMSAAAPGTAPQGRVPDGIYQNNRRVARVIDPEVDTAAKEIRFVELYDSDLLLLPEECEYQKYRLVVKRIEYASKVNKEEPHKGRILRNVAAEIVGYREQ